MTSLHAELVSLDGKREASPLLTLRTAGIPHGNHPSNDKTRAQLALHEYIAWTGIVESPRWLVRVSLIA